MAPLYTFVFLSHFLSALQILHYIPKATLGAVICNAVITLVDWPEFIKVRSFFNMRSLFLSHFFSISLFIFANTL